jgi:hypothetical protein
MKIGDRVTIKPRASFKESAAFHNGFDSLAERGGETGTVVALHDGPLGVMLLGATGVEVKLDLEPTNDGEGEGFVLLSDEVEVIDEAA